MITSFGFKHDLVPAHDLLFDVRDLPNPHRQFSTLDGRHEHVKAWVMTHGGDARVRQIVGKVRVWQHDQMEYHPELTSPPPCRVAIGCTGGRHRSVVIATAVGMLLSAVVTHRDIPTMLARSDGAVPAGAR